MRCHLAEATNEPKRVVAPVVQSNRITSIDVLRGVAILGILLMNLPSFAQPRFDNPMIYGGFHGADLAAWLFCRVFANLKFLSIFSMLFGVGIYLFTSHIEAVGKSSAGLHYRRMIFLLSFGLLHGYLLWFGDILAHYAICGMLVYPLRKLSVRKLLIVGGILFAVPVVSGSIYILTMTSEQHEEFRSEFRPTQTEISQSLATYRGSWLAQESTRANETLEFETSLFAWEYFWREFGLMLVGIALFKIGFFSAQMSKALYQKLIAVAATIGIPLTLYSFYANYHMGWQSERVYFLGEFLDYFSSLFISFGWVSVVMLLCQSAHAVPIQRSLQSVGRAAFSNYILQTVICTILFYGEGFALYGRVSRCWQLGIVCLIWAFQIVVSNLWFRYFRMGPLESLWRSLTYWKPQPLRLPVAMECLTCHPA